MLINLSNHPVEGIWNDELGKYVNEWDPNQLKTAIETWDKIEYIPFPKIPSEASYSDVKHLAEEYLQKCLDTFGQQHTNTEQCVLLTGEIVFCSIISQLLLREGIRVVCATTERNNINLGNGKSLKGFRFISFRDYGIPVKVKI